MTGRVFVRTLAREHGTTFHEGALRARCSEQYRAHGEASSSMRGGIKDPTSVVLNVRSSCAITGSLRTLRISRSQKTSRTAFDFNQGAPVEDVADAI